MDIGLVLLLFILTSGLVVAITWKILDRSHNRTIQGFNSIVDAVNHAQQVLMAAQKSHQDISAAVAKRQQEYALVSARTKELVALEGRANEIREILQNGQSRIDALKSQIAEQSKVGELMKSETQQIKSELDLYSRLMDFVDFGLFEEPQYLHETSERYKAEIDQVRASQREMVRDRLAVETPDDIEVEGSSQKGKSILDGQTRMMLRAFNIECDFLIEKVSPSNFARTLDRIEKIADALERSAISLTN